MDSYRDVTARGATMAACTRPPFVSICMSRRVDRSRRSAPSSVRSSRDCAIGSESPRPRSATTPSGSGPRSPRPSSRRAIHSCAKCSRRSSASWWRRPRSSCSTSRPHGSRASGRERMTSAKRYPRTARVNEVMLEVLADELERMGDPRLELVTLTGVDVSRDLAHAKVYYSTLTATAVDTRASIPDDVATALHAAGSHLRGVVGRQMRIRQVPRLAFLVDPGIVAGQRIEDILREIHHRKASTDESGDADGGEAS